MTSSEARRAFLTGRHSIKIWQAVGAQGRKEGDTKNASESVTKSKILILVFGAVSDSFDC